MKSFLIRKVRLAFGLALFTLLAMGVFTYRWMLVSDESSNWVRHSHDVLTSIHELSLAMESIESDSRGFVLTGKESDLESYRANVARITQDQANLRALTADNAAQQIHFPDLEVLAAERIQHADMLIDLRRTQGQEAAVAAFGSSPDKQGSEFQALVGTMLNAEMHLRTQRVAATKQYVSQTKQILLFGSLMGLLIVTAAAWFAVRDSSTREAAEARYRGLMEAAPDGMVVVNQNGEIVLLNVQAEKQFGYRGDELLGQKVTNIIPEGFAERLSGDGTRTTAEALAQQIGTGIELHGRRKDGSEFPIEIMLSPLDSPEGAQVTAAIRDISERKQLEQQLHQSQKMEAIGQLTGGIAHDFNNLLGVIIGNLDLLDRLVASNEAAVRRVRTAQKAAMRGADITRRLLMFSSSEELKPSVIRLGDSIQNMIELASRAIGAEIKITTRVDESVPPLFVDPVGLESALLNLVANARDAMPKGGSITIAADVQNLGDSHPTVLSGDLKAGHYVHVSVSDTGQGMSRETLERAFEPFFTTKPRNKATGLGLAMVYGFAKQSGGVVRAYSELGQGTTVSLYLPIAMDQLQSMPSGAPEPLNARLSGTVLVVDDEVDLLEVALTYLADMNLKAYKAIDGASALMALREHNEIDLMMTDIVMPGGMNGVELAQKALALRPDLKIIYSSGFPAEALAEKSMPLADGLLLHKPYQRAEFVAIIHRVMEDKHATPVNELAFSPSIADRQTGAQRMEK
ncbi:MAG: CHASE3 domain-containing protein [Terracidiphilus sp.]|nr:CHASE3 domain-containing protein [Terracidiphilus sp.]